MRICVLLAVTLALALPLSSCGGSDDTSASDATAASENTGSEDGSTSEETAIAEPVEPPTAVSTGSPGPYGSVIVNRVGFTLYTFSKDQRNSGKTACYGKCAKLWAPAEALGELEAVQKTDPALLGTITRKEGLEQITYNGWPMYTYSPEPSGRAEGFGLESFGGVWYPVNVAGELVEDETP